MTTDLPFAPPYKLKLAGADGDHWVEVQADGSQVATSAPVWPAAGAASPSPSASRPKTGAAPQAAAVLKVPFAEKDEAKRLGARWDAARKKWYVPAGVELAPFARWMAD